MVESDPVESLALELRRELGDEALARVTRALRTWQDGLEREWAELPARLAVAPRGRSTSWLLERWLEGRVEAARAAPGTSAEDRALVRLQLATLGGLKARLEGEGGAEPAPDAAPRELARYVLTLEGRDAPLGNLASILELWAQVVARGARGDAALARFEESRIRLGPAPGELSVTFEGTPELVGELRALLGRVGAKDA